MAGARLINLMSYLAVAFVVALLALLAFVTLTPDSSGSPDAKGMVTAAITLALLFGLPVLIVVALIYSFFGGSSPAPSPTPRPRELEGANREGSERAP
ncbi:hypothetical protein GCM10027188_29170 [Lysobacter humi (ex Lee et al. 2017)]